MDERFPLSEMPPHDRPIPERVICDTPEALSEAVANVGEWDDVVVVERNGKRVAAIISEADLELFQRLLWDKEMEQDVAAAEEALRELEADGGKTIPLEQLMDELGIARPA